MESPGGLVSSLFKLGCCDLYFNKWCFFFWCGLSAWCLISLTPYKVFAKTLDSSFRSEVINSLVKLSNTGSDSVQIGSLSSGQASRLIGGIIWALYVTSSVIEKCFTYTTQLSPSTNSIEAYGMVVCGWWEGACLRLAFHERDPYPCS